MEWTFRLAEEPAACLSRYIPGIRSFFSAQFESAEQALGCQPPPRPAPTNVVINEVLLDRWRHRHSYAAFEVDEAS
jgi:hypothetical protein